MWNYEFVNRGDTHRIKGAIKVHWESVRSHVHEIVHTGVPYDSCIFHATISFGPCSFRCFMFQLVVSPQIVLFRSHLTPFVARYYIIFVVAGLQFLLWHFFACACCSFFIINLGVCLIFPWFEPHFFFAVALHRLSILGSTFMARSVRWIRIRHERTCHTCTSSYLTRAWLRFLRTHKTKKFIKIAESNKPFGASGHCFCGTFKSRVAHSHF